MVGNVGITFDSKRIEKNLEKAQMKLNMQVVADCDPLIPFRQGALRGSVNYPEGIKGGVIEWNTPYAHYMYAGEVYSPNIPMFDADNNLIGFFSPPGKKKDPTGRPLTYHEPGTTSHWFDVAKSRHLREWVDMVKRTVGGD